MTRVVTDADVQYILDHADMTDKQLSAELGYKWSTIRGVRRRHGCIKPHHITMLPDEFLTLYENCGYNCTQMAQRLQVDRHTIMRIAKELGIGTSKSKNFTQDDLQHIIDGYYTTTAHNLAEEMGCSTSLISAIWNKHGLKVKETRKYYIDHNYFDAIDTSNKAYLLGFIASDGCLYHPVVPDDHNKQDIIRISISSDDEQVLEAFRSELHYDKPIYHFSRNNKSYSALEISSSKMVTDIRKYGISFRKTYGNCIADVSDDMFPHFLRGYFDGDGSISKDNDTDVHVSISGYQNNMMTIIGWLEKRNIYACFTHDLRKKYKGDQPFGMLTFTNRMQKYAFLKLIYEDSNNFLLQRKYETAKAFITAVESDTSIRNKQIVQYYNYAVRKAS